MKKLFTTIALLLAVLLLPDTTLAHQPRIVKENPTVVTFAEVSKAYYGTLGGEPAVYVIKAEKTFSLYVGLLVPDIPGQKRMSLLSFLKMASSSHFWTVQTLSGSHFLKSLVTTRTGRGQSTKHRQMQVLTRYVSQAPKTTASIRLL